MSRLKKTNNKIKGLNVRVTDKVWAQIESFRSLKSKELGFEISRSAAISMLISKGLAVFASSELVCA